MTEIPAGKMSDVVPLPPEMGGDQPAGVLDVIIRYGGREHTCKGLIDSGGMTALIPEEIAVELGLPIARSGARTAIGFGGPAQIVPAPGVTIEWGEETIASEVCVALGAGGSPVLLGLRDLFTSFDIEFGLGQDPPIVRITPRSGSQGLVPSGTARTP
jgi:hypothetical protein